MYNRYLILLAVIILLPTTIVVTSSQAEGTEIAIVPSSADENSPTVSPIDQDSPKTTLASKEISASESEVDPLDSAKAEPEESLVSVQGEVLNSAKAKPEGGLAEKLEENFVSVQGEIVDRQLLQGEMGETDDPESALWIESAKEPTPKKETAQEGIEALDNPLLQDEEEGVLWNEPPIEVNPVEVEGAVVRAVEEGDGEELVFLYNNAERGKIKAPTVTIKLAKKLEFVTEDDLESISVPKYYVPDIPLVSNERVEAFINMYTNRKRAVLKRAIARSPKYMRMIHRVFREHGLPLNLAYLAVVESNFNPIARSRVRATGLWQFMGYTGKIFGLRRSWWHDDRIDPERATVAAAKYLKQLYRQFKGDWELALAAYNTGGGRVRKELRKARRSGKPQNFWVLKLPRETRGYVPAFYAVATIFSNLHSYGFDPAPEPEEEITKQVANVPGGVSLKQVATILKTDSRVLAKLNPRLMRGITPAIYKKFEIAIPPHLTLGAAEYKKLAKGRKQFWKFHRVRKGESLWSLSRKFQIPISKIKSFNQMRRNLLRIGQKIMLPLPADWTPRKYAKRHRSRKGSSSRLNYVHVVVRGETLWSIANRFNLSMRNIKRWNRKVLRSRFLKVGTPLRLKLPVKVTLAI
jgi:LysM repeat protein